MSRPEHRFLPPRQPSKPRGGLCVETQSREIMAVLVHDVVADAMRLGLYDEPAERVVKANGARLESGRETVRNG